MALKLYEEEYISLLAQQLRAAQGSETQFLLSELPAGYEAVIEELTSRIFDTSDATAAAEDIAAGRTAYVDGALVEGALTVRSDMDFRTVEADSLGTTGSGNTMWIRMGYEERGDFIARQGTGTTLRKSASAFGDATAADVVSGKTFTSAAGLKVEGTHECAAGAVTKTGTVTLDADASSIEIDTGLSSVLAVSVKRDGDPSVSATYRWMMAGTHTLSVRQSVGSSAIKTYFIGASNMTVSGGTVTVRQNSSTSVITAGTYLWEAIGDE